MGDVFIGIAGALIVASTVCAVIAIRTGWMPPWLRRTLRPRLWGYSTLIGNAGICLWLFAFRADGMSTPAALAAGVLFAANMAISPLANRPGRVRQEPQ
ncbi:hypothetical protein [Streptomyces adelaidensis]|uniref:hypothetical protein n=1 Tax=Streptomyces adelaidensis TaxID=2796465 RepID=UPI001F1A5359|nr:hypothetical protein [Streptomyces adelaidensis]